MAGGARARALTALSQPQVASFLTGAPGAAPETSDACGAAGDQLTPMQPIGCALGTFLICIKGRLSAVTIERRAWPARWTRCHAGCQSDTVEWPGKGPAADPCAAKTREASAPRSAHLPVRIGALRVICQDRNRAIRRAACQTQAQLVRRERDAVHGPLEQRRGCLVHLAPLVATRLLPDDDSVVE